MQFSSQKVVTFVPLKDMYVKHKFAEYFSTGYTKQTTTVHGNDSKTLRRVVSAGNEGVTRWGV